MYVSLSFILFFNDFSTTTNCPAAPAQPVPADIADLTGNGNNNNNDNNIDVEENADSPKWKRKTKSQMDREEQFNKLLKVAQQEDHPVELALAAISKQMQRSLNEEEQDELLDELHSVASKFFREKRRRERRQVSAAQPSTSSTSNPTPPPPPLLWANERPAQIQQVPVQSNLQAPLQQSTGKIGEMLFDVSSLPPMQGYNVELVRDSEGGTYMKMKSKYILS